MRIPTRSSMRACAIALSGSVLIVSAFTGCTPDVKDMRTEGISEYHNKQYIESMATMRHALELNPNDAQSNYYMGLNYETVAARKFKEGDVVAAKRELDTAIVYFTQAIKTWPNYMAAVQAKTDCFELRGKYDQAVQTAETVADNNRGIAEHYVFLGNEYRDRGDYDNALRAYKLAVSNDACSASAYEGMGKLYDRVGDIAEASEAHRKAMELSQPPSQRTQMASPSAKGPASPKPSSR